ncbi:FAD:protein FMN transferase [Lactococcus allomyrinae]|uniref:FAD:protein FMN transferase n=1 Tax=Lactococcus allomyrinae TaxID=2419773 RepID=A0A387BKQ2_9LACT|nr:FAD:protein FMN transferase [Lactococcus allomyrinae]AYG01779.1 FAD:protein FMN transferase [Lactococcus allomyrinae]
MEKLDKIATKKISKRYRALGTVIDLTIYGTTDEQLLDDGFRLIKYYEDIFTVNREQSELMMVNDAAGISAVQVSDPVYQLTKIAVGKSQEHFGFNAAIGPLVKLWHIGFSDARLPQQSEIDEYLKLISPDEIILNDEEFSIFLPKKGMEIDLGGIAKGYIADRVQDLWRAHGISSGMINLGGNLILMGEAPHQKNRKWRVGIRNPLNNNGISIAQILTRESSVVTSGIAERHMEVDGKSYHHIIDPETGYPHNNQIASVTVLSKRSIDGEIETTRLFFANQPIENWLENHPDVYGAIFISRDKKIKVVGIPQSQVYIADSSFEFE